MSRVPALQTLPDMLGMGRALLVMAALISAGVAPGFLAAYRAAAPATWGEACSDTRQAP